MNVWLVLYDCFVEDFVTPGMLLSTDQIFDPLVCIQKTLDQQYTYRLVAGKIRI